MKTNARSPKIKAATRDLSPGVRRVRYLGGHRLQIAFTDGRRGTVDFAPYVIGRGPMVKPLEDPAFFKKVRIDPDFQTLVWPNDVDWCPDVLYWLVTGTPIAYSTDQRYHVPPPHLQKRQRRIRHRVDAEKATKRFSTEPKRRK